MTPAQLAHLAEQADFAAGFFRTTNPSVADRFTQCAAAARQLAKNMERKTNSAGFAPNWPTSPSGSSGGHNSIRMCLFRPSTTGGSTWTGVSSVSDRERGLAHGAAETGVASTPPPAWAWELSRHCLAGTPDRWRHSIRASIQASRWPASSPRRHKPHCKRRPSCTTSATRRSSYGQVSTHSAAPSSSDP